LRKLDDEKMMILLNFSSKEQPVIIDDERFTNTKWKHVFGGEDCQKSPNKWVLPGYGLAIYLKI